MDDRHRSALTKNRKFLVDNLNLEEVRDQLESDGVVSPGQMELIDSKPAAQGKIRELLVTLPRSGPDAFNKFIQILDKIPIQKYIADRLVKTLSEICNDAEREDLLPPRLETPDPVENPVKATVEAPIYRTVAAPIYRTAEAPLSRAVQATDEVLTSLPEIASSLPDPTSCYVKGTGRLLVINNDEFSSLNYRKGSKKDVKNLAETLEQFGFDNAITYHNVVATDVAKKVADFVNDPKTKAASCVICVILSHGDTGGKICGSDDATFCDKDVLTEFYRDHAIGLQGKPKLVMFQCCRGEDVDAGTAKETPVAREVSDGRLGGTRSGNQKSAPVIHAAADILSVYATAEGEKSFRNEKEGSWMIQQFCKILASNGKKDHVADILTEVNRQVSHSAATAEHPTVVQLMDTRNTLRKKWYLGE